MYFYFCVVIRFYFFLFNSQLKSTFQEKQFIGNAPSGITTCICARLLVLAQIMTGTRIEKMSRIRKFLVIVGSPIFKNGFHNVVYMVGGHLKY